MKLIPLTMKLISGIRVIFRQLPSQKRLDALWVGVNRVTILKGVVNRELVRMEQTTIHEFSSREDLATLRSYLQISPPVGEPEIPFSLPSFRILLHYKREEPAVLTVNYNTLLGSYYWNSTAPLLDSDGLNRWLASRETGGA